MMIDERMERLKLNLDHKWAIQKPRLLHLEVRLNHANPLMKIQDHRFILENARKNMIARWHDNTEHLKARVETHMAVLDTLSPLAVLRRGYSIVKKLPEGTIVKEAASVTVGSRVDVKVSSGSFHANVTEVNQE